MTAGTAPGLPRKLVKTAVVAAVIAGAWLVVWPGAWPGAIGSARACGPTSDCDLGDRSYRIALPPGHDGMAAIGAIVHLHGWRSRPQAVMRNKGLRRVANDLGVALVAPKSKQDDWALVNAPRAPPDAGTVELVFFDRLVDDIAARFNIDTDRLLATGFSAGGMMVWTLACERPGLFAGFAPVAGTFWHPVPATCRAPMRHLFHFHGSRDTMVPLTGRPIAGTRQGNVYQALALYRRNAGVTDAPPARFATLDLDCRRWTGVDRQVLEFCLFDGGHSHRPAYVRHAWERLLALGALSDPATRPPMKPGRP